MADDKVLTVAELLARNADERAKAEGSSSGESSRRRRRRSLDEGGVSVAELTGGIKRVEASPAESKHSNVPLEGEAPVVPAGKKSDRSEGAEDKAQPQRPNQEPGSSKDAESKQAKAATQQESKPVQQPAPKPSVKEAKAANSKVSAGAETSVFQKVSAPAADKSADSAFSAGPAKGGPASATTSSEETGEIPAVVAEEPLTMEDQKEAAAYEAYGEQDGDNSGKLNPVAVVLLAVLGVILGAILFKGFEILWGRFDRIIVGVLAVAVTAVMVGLVHVLRTGKDSFSMALGGIVGLVLTFGPLAIILL